MSRIARRLFGAGFLRGICLLGGSSLALADGVDQRLADIAAAGRFGQGSSQAREACNELSRGGPQILPRLLVAMDTPNVVAANWYRAAYERVIARELARAHPELPTGDLKAYVRDARRRGFARRLALELLDRVEPAFGKALVPTLLDDPEFRDDAVELALKQGDDLKIRGDVVEAKRRYAAAFRHARNAEQVRAAATKLESAGETVDIVKHLGFVTDWYLVGPFAAPGMTGFSAVFSPERSIDLAAPVAADGKPGLRWNRHQTNDLFGTVDLVRIFGPVKEAVAYAYTELDSPAARPAELRCSADDCLAVWLNGEKVFGRAMWLNGTRLDRFITRVHLRAGRNHLLVKACQGPQHRDPTVGNAWTFQLRLCTPDGTGLTLKSVIRDQRHSALASPSRSEGKR